MSLIYCPECSHEMSANAVACPNCGHPNAIPAPVAVEEPVVAAVVPPVTRREGFPPWAFVPIGLLGLVLLVVAYMAFRTNDDEGNTNIRISRTSNKSAEPVRETRTTVPATETHEVIPPSSSGAPVVSQPEVVETRPSTQAPVITTPAPPPDKATVSISASVASSRSGKQAVKNEKFYLLDRSLESILSEAGVEPIEGNDLAASLGLAVLNPGRYSEFRQKAMKAINKHIKYSGTTDGRGTANLANVVPKEYYLFAVTNAGRGYALWDQPVSIVAGSNMLELTPQTITEVMDTSGQYDSQDRELRRTGSMN